MIALYPGAYKPPHRGHFEVVKSLLNGNYKGKAYDVDDYIEAGQKLMAGNFEPVQKINKVIVFIGGGVRNGISPEESKQVWEIYSKYLSNVEVIVGDKNPMVAAKEYAKAQPSDEFYAVTGVRSEEDFPDLRRITTFKNRENVTGLALTAPSAGDVRATNFRKAILGGNLDDIRDFFPEQLAREDIMKAVNILKQAAISEAMNETIEGLFEEMFTENNSGTPIRNDVMRSDTRSRLVNLYNYVSNLLPQGSSIRLVGDHIRVGLKELEAPDRYDYTPYIGGLLEYMLDQKMNIQPLPEVVIKRDIAEGEDFFGKTAYYDPNAKKVVLYVQGRHPKDVVRSFSHEMIHHMQNIEGRLGNITTSNTNEDDSLLELEKEAYLKGNICFRNWEDSVKNPKKKVVSEGGYDKLTNTLSAAVFAFFKQAIQKGKDASMDFKVGPDEDADIKHTMEFDLEAHIKISDDTYSVDGGANAGYDDDGDEIDPFINVVFQVPKDIDLQKLSFDIKDVVRHEIEHLTQDGANLKPGKYIPDDQDLRDLIDSGLLDQDNYYKLPKEVDAMIQGMYYKAKKSKTPFKDVVDDYFEKAKVTAKERPVIKALWNKRLPALGIKQRL